MNILDTAIADLQIVQSLPHRDARGAFIRLFCAQELQPVLGQRQIAQTNTPELFTPGPCVACISNTRRMRK